MRLVMRRPMGGRKKAMMIFGTIRVSLETPTRNKNAGIT